MNFSAWRQRTISIHAPARGATINHTGYVYKVVDFNPRSRKGSDAAVFFIPFFRGDFNPRSRKGSDPTPKPIVLPVRYFNPRSRKGSDALTFSAWNTIIAFQSTLPQGERLARKAAKEAAAKISIHAPARGATQQYGIFLSEAPISIHAPARGATAIITNFHTHCLPSFIPKLSFPRYLTILCAIFPVRIPHRFYVCFRFAPDYKISVWSAAVPRSTPICSTFVWYLFPR